MDTFFIRPACPGADIRDPETGDRLTDEGQDKPRTPHWIGLQIRGDVVEGPQTTEAAPPAPAAEAADPQPPPKAKADKTA